MLRNKTMIKVAKPCHQAASKKGEQIEKANVSSGTKVSSSLNAVECRLSLA